MPIKLGELLVRANVITDGQLKASLSEQQKWGGRLGEILVRMEYCSEEIIIRALSKQLGLQRVDLDPLESVPETVLGRVPAQMARDLDVIPLQLRDEGKTLVVALADPLNIEILDALRARTGCRIVPLLAGPTALARARARFYDGEAELETSGDDNLRLTDALGRTVPEALDTAPQGDPPVAQSATDVLDRIEAAQRKEAAAVRVMVELLIDRGVFTRDEYLARVKR